MNSNNNELKNASIELIENVFAIADKCNNISNSSNKRNSNLRELSVAGDIEVLDRENKYSLPEGTIVISGYDCSDVYDKDLLAIAVRPDETIQLRRDSYADLIGCDIPSIKSGYAEEVTIRRSEIVLGNDIEVWSREGGFICDMDDSDKINIYSDFSSIDKVPNAKPCDKKVIKSRILNAALKDSVRKVISASLINSNSDSSIKTK